MVNLASDSDFNELLAQNPKLVVKFFADWCGTCKLFAPKYKRLSEDDRFSDIAFIEVNAEVSPETRRKAGVSNLPYIATFENGVFKTGIATGKEEAVIDLLTNF